ncbi:MAG TPA: FtsK/SpoIIIE domain-containing protein [Streptosporangiaceae bacterium]|nr:FtsK/SpoIIIE domain-containing protein [Streptosporangiaceae bacterium]
MTNYRTMRRQARLARRSGLQPMMMINTGDGFPETLGLVLARQVWRYRSELAPPGVAAGLVAAAWWLHHTRPHWWVPVSVAAGLAAWAVALFGARWRFPTLPERIYAAGTIYAGGIWLSIATAIGPFFRPLPQALVISTLILSIPWWAHRRRRAKVALERKLQAWPDIAKAVGLAGIEVMSATVDVWGWRARLRLARGQTLKDVTAKIPVIESGLGTFRGAVRIYPTPDDLANRCEIRVLNMDPHAGAIPWPGPSVSSITQPIDMGPFEDASPCRIPFARLHGIFGGTTGSGKSGGLNVLMGNLVACRDVVIWAIDLKKGMELGPWESCIDRLATTPEEAVTLLRDAVAVLQARAALLAAAGKRGWPISAAMPALVILIDEYAELADEAPAAMSDTDSIARLGRAVAVTLIAATQRPTQKAMGAGAVRSQMDLRICFRVREPRDVDLILGQGMLKAGWDAHNLNAPGKFLVSAPGHDRPSRARAYLVTDEAVTHTAAHYANVRPVLDAESRRAIDSARWTRSESRDSAPAPANPEETEQTRETTDSALWHALCAAPGEGLEVSELMRITGWKRTKLYRHLREYAEAGRAVQVSRGRWRAQAGEPSP